MSAVTPPVRQGTLQGGRVPGMMPDRYDIAETGIRVRNRISVVNEGFRWMYDRIVVPLDGSKFAEEALAHARTLATRLNVPIHLVRSIDPSGITGFGAALGVGLDYTAVDALIDEEETDAKTYIHEAVTTLNGDHLNATGVVLRGTAAAVIVATCQDGDLVVMASHGRSGVRRWFLGSVAEEVLRRSDVPVLLIRLHLREAD